MSRRALTPGPAAFAVAFVVACGSSPANRPEQLAPQNLNLSGEWVLNREASDDPRAQLEEMRGGERAPGSGRGGMPGRATGRPPGGPPGGARGRPRGAMDPESRQEVMRMAMDAVERFSVRQDDSSVTITYDRGPAYSYRPDGRKRKQETPRGTPVSVTARWKDQGLTVERAADGGEIITRYMLGAEGDQLHVVTRLEMGPRMRLEFQRVYDRVRIEGG